LPSESALLERWLAEVLEVPGITAIRDPHTARRFLLEDAVRALHHVAGERGPVVDVGSGTGSPGLPLAVALPGTRFALLDAERRKCDFLRRFAGELDNVEVVWGRAEEQPPATYGVALAKALARPPVAVELTLPLVREGGAVLLWCGESADRRAIERAAGALAGALENDDQGLLVLRKIGATPAGFPRRPGMARKRPLGG
jgi:16S rRNA (guanine527-N7)-methyltransferase